MHVFRTRRSALTLAASAAVALMTVAPACSSTGAVAPSPEIALGPCTSPDFAGAPFGIHCNALVDSDGRSVMLHGVNARVRGLFDVTFTDGRVALEEIPDFTEADAARMRSLGYNTLRLPVNWSGLEPTEDGGFVEAYLTRLAEVVEHCKKAGIYVFFSIHQDAYSKEIGQDGAPLWAIKPPPTKLLEGPLKDLSERVLSDQVGSAFGTFFGDSADGAYLRKRFGAMAAHLIAAFADNDTVIGVDLFNEPVAGEDQIISFYRELLPGLRAVAPKKLFLFEPSGARNLKDSSPVGTGSLAPGTIYAPHVYTAVFGANSARRDTLTIDDLTPSNERARAEADGWQAPLLIGEFGFSPFAANFEFVIRTQLALQEAQRTSSTTWLWKEQSEGAWGFYAYDTASDSWAERPSVISAHARVRVERASGRIAKVGYDPAAREFSMTLVGDAKVTAPNVLTIGETAGFKGGTFDATCDGKRVAPEAAGAADPVAIACGGAGAHTLVLKAR